jgi:hypothetical protein
LDLFGENGENGENEVSEVSEVSGHFGHFVAAGVGGKTAYSSLRE